MQLLALRKKQTLSVVQKIQDKYERNGKLVDAEMRAAFPSPPPLAQLDDEQKLVVESCRLLECEEGGKWDPLDSPYPFVTMHIKHDPPAKGERHIAVGKATATIDCSMREAMAFWSMFMSRESTKASVELSNPARLVPRGSGPLDTVVATIKKMPFVLRDREFVARQVCAMDTDGDFLVAAVPIDEIVDYGMSTRTVRGVFWALTRFTSLGDSQCKITYTQKLDAGGRIPTWLVRVRAKRAYLIDERTPVLTRYSTHPRLVPLP